MQDDPLGGYPPPAPNGAPAYQPPTYQNPMYQNPGYQNPGYQNPGYQNPGYQNPGDQSAGSPRYVSSAPVPVSNPVYPGKQEAKACMLWGILSLIFFLVPVVPVVMPLICYYYCVSNRKAYHRVGGEMYDEDVKTGRVCANCALALVVLSVIALIAYVLFFVVLSVHLANS